MSKPMKITACQYMLGADTYDLRKQDRNQGWKILTNYGNDFIYFANRFSLSTAVFKSRKADKLITPPQLIMIDVDEPGDNTEEKLLLWGLYYFKVPSGSNNGKEVNYKWHYFVKLSHPLHKTPAIAKGQIKKFYAELGIEGYDPTAIDTARYFAPGGAMEILGTPAWDERVKWCDANSKEVEGTAYVPADAENVDAIYSGSGKQVYIRPDNITDGPEDAEWEPTLKCKRKADGGHSWRLEHDTPISLGRGNWSTAGDLAGKINNGETVSNLIGCPGFNHQHTDPSTVGYGYITRKDNMVFFNCGGNSCAGETYFLVDEVEQTEFKKLKFGKEK